MIISHSNSRYKKRKSEKSHIQIKSNTNSLGQEISVKSEEKFRNYLK